MDSLLELFCDVDDFCQSFIPTWKSQLLSAGAIQRQRDRGLSLSEIMTILIHFHQSHYRDFKAYYTEYVQERLHKEFPGLVSYTRLSNLSHRCSFRCVFICAVPALEPAPASRSWIPPPWRCVKTQESTHTRSLQGWRSVAKPPPAGSLASNCTSFSMTEANYSICCSHLAM